MRTQIKTPRRTTALAALAAALVASLCLTGSGLAAAKRQFRPNCRSGKTLFRHGAARAFWVSFYDVVDGGTHQEALVCRPRSRKPVAIFDPGPFNYVQAGRFHLIGKRLGFVIHDQGFSNGSETDVGWIDLRSGSVRLGLLNAGENASPTDPLLPEDSIGYAFASDGSAAVIAGSACQVVAVLPIRSKPYDSIYRLGPPVVLYTALHGGLDTASVAITDTAVTWRTTAGAPGSAPRSASTPGSTRTPSQSGGC